MPKLLFLTKRKCLPCVVPNCPSLWKGPGGKRTDIKFFSFPGPRRSKVWLKACNREDLLDLATCELNNRFKICELHFAAKHFSLSRYGGKSLSVVAVPTIFPRITNPPIKVKTECGIQQIPNRTVQNIDYTTPTLRMTSQAVPKQHAPIQVFKVDIKGQNSVLTPVNVGLEDIKQMTPIPGPFATTTSLFRLQEFARTFYSEQNNFPNDDIKMNELKSSSSHITEKATVQTKGPVLEQPNRVPPGIHQGCVNELFTPPNPPLDQKTPNGASISINTFISKSILRKHILDRKKATQIPGFSQSETLRKLHKIKSLQRQVVVKVTKSLEVKV
ncbi:unnamed protein product [Ceutorhynchus assimilis]|uniref:THAP-type domain-containing protein n=1 Tax=Ceutorhynchus assimilis TaxID=467358 RepID=A0A9N9MLS0_9CUCU|nr:unnamed protein product [Ceutorhynchus assimilis]